MKIKNLLLAATAIVAFAMTVTAQTIPSYIPTNGLVGYWPFNGNANDESGNGNHGTVNGATLTTDRNGVAGKAYSFNGVSNWIDAINAGPTGTGITLSYWFKSNQTSLGGIFCYGGNNWGTQFEILHNYWSAQTTGPCHGPALHNSGSLVSFNSNQFLNNNFHHVVLILPQNASSVNSLYTYIDGSLINNYCSFANYGAPAPNIGSDYPIRIGKNINYGNGTVYFNGTLDDIAIYNRALTQTEITALYISVSPCTPTSSTSSLTIPSTSLPYTWNGLTFNAAGSQTKTLTNVGGCDSTATLNLTVINTALPSYLPANGLVGYWPFNGNANDESGNGNHGILLNGVTLSTDRLLNLNSSYTIDGIDGLNKGIKIPVNLIGTEYTTSLWFMISDSTKGGGTSSQAIICAEPFGVMGCGFNHPYYPNNMGSCIGDSYNWNICTGGMSNTWQLQNKQSWHLLTIIKTFVEYKYYIDGILKRTQSIGPSNSVFISEFYLGAIRISSGEVFKGKLDDIAIYNRALTQTEITQLYTNCIATTSSTNLTIPSTSLPYTWNGLTFNAAGSQTKTLTNVGGCDSTATLNLTVINTALPSYLPANGLVGWWPFNGNANDESGNGNNATVNGAILVGDRFGDSTNAYSFDGLDDFISSSPNLPINSAPRSVVSWFKTNTIYINTSQYNHVQCINGWGSSTSGKVIFPQNIVAPSGKAWFETGSSSNSIYSNNSVNNFQWHQIVTTYNGSGTSIKLYIDGLLQDSTNNLILNTYNSNFIIGNAPWANIPFRGLIDDVAIYNRALTSSEITSLYNSSQNTIKLNLTAFLEGSYTGSSMTATPNIINAAIPNSIADSIIVELHASTSPYATMYSSNGVLNTNGTASIAFPNSAIGSSYYIAIKHRNAIETWSAAPVTISNHTIYNFTTAASQAYGNNLSNMGDGVFGMYSGDINQDGSIDFSDYPDLDIANNSGVLGYNVNDLNGDASVDFNDYPLLDINSNNGIIAMRP
jgi:hypothetical protein